jgi:ribosomal-protein-alanine N-acetyltransferase
MQTEDLPQMQQILPLVLPGVWTLDNLRNFMQSTHACRVLVGADEQIHEVLGFAEFQLVVDECQLFNIAIAREFQGQGLGRKLLQLVLKEARDAGCTSCFLEVRRSNDAAIALYAALGFVLVGMRKDYYPPMQPGQAREDALLYTLAW